MEMGVDFRMGTRYLTNYERATDFQIYLVQFPTLNNQRDAEYRWRGVRCERLFGLQRFGSS